MEEWTVSGGNHRPVQKTRQRSDGWTKKRRQIFVNTLAGTCNVRMAVAATGLGISSAYALRRRDPAFAALWKEALSIGYERLEEAMLEVALEGVNAIDIQIDGEVVVPSARDAEDGPPKVQPGSGASAARPSPADVQIAMLVLNRHRASVEGKGQPAARRRATSEETDEALRKKLDVLARQLREPQ